nr:MAG TPA: hypothetical protein [Caudoviricetes sp.]DAO50255.1 MAG TPA: hypothetical protein [Caudoviricetes sp.]DAQ34168.1 MAG TPA: hypothetical protein [Caudoviricetes sp.]DAR35396.1 MAG TPA: hypothetical protein [Caudoviricetes sp.]DAS26020.1 MAG TPA: hypothetical protein [Caudoviricetes sp.]
MFFRLSYKVKKRPRGNLRRFSFDFKGGEYLDQEAKAVC